ncbi:MAG: hypothetical protein DRQ78_05725, partial [Epsilonproteobacteria bacterium]
MHIKRLIFIFIGAISMAFSYDIDLNQLIVEEKKTNKQLLVFLHITGCDYCLRMEEFTFDDFKVSKIKFAKEIGYAMYPSCLFFDKNGELVYDEVGYKDEDRFLE